MKKWICIYLPFYCLPFRVAAQNSDELNAYAKYDFIAGEKIVFDDNMLNEKTGAAPAFWNMEGGEAIIEASGDDRYISVKQYYTKFSPKYDVKIVLPDTFTIEYDTWLDAGYDGNPGIEIHLMQGDDQSVITPNATTVNCQYPGGEKNGETPEAIRGEKFYDRWNHIAISYAKPSLIVYVDQFKMFEIPDCKIDPDKILVSGNTSQDMKILLKNFRVAKSIPAGNFEKEITKGIFITHAIRFDVNRAEIKPESMTVLNDIYQYLKANPAVHIEIDGHTDSDGDDASNLKLSEARAEAVKTQLVNMGIPAAQITAKGLGETKPMDKNTTPEGKANNRRVEFIKI